MFSWPALTSVASFSMAYRDQQMCHICGAETRLVCPCCQDAVCEEHTLAGQMEGAPTRQREEAERLARRLGSADACGHCVERELEQSRGPFVELLRSSDPIQTQMVLEALLEEGFDARTFGTQNAALLGAGQNIFEQRIEVPEPQAEAARELAEVLVMPQNQLPEQVEERAGGEEEMALVEANPGPGVLSLRRKGLAAGLAFIFPGGSHYYTGRPWTGMILTALFFSGLPLIMGQSAGMGAALLLGVPAADIVGGQVAAGKANRGESASAAAQLGVGMLMGGILFALGALLG